MTRGVLVTHAELGAAFVQAVEGFLGPQEGLVAISSAGLTPDGLAQAIAEVAGDGDELFFFCDLDGGSCAGVCARVARGNDHAVSISGLNLPMLIEFCHYRERLSGGALLERVLRKGRDGVVARGGDLPG